MCQRRLEIAAVVFRCPPARRWTIRRPPRYQDSGRCFPAWYGQAAVEPPEVPSASIDQGHLGPSQRVVIVQRRVEADRSNPAISQPRVAPGSQVFVLSDPARKRHSPGRRPPLVIHRMTVLRVCSVISNWTGRPVFFGWRWSVAGRGRSSARRLPARLLGTTTQLTVDGWVEHGEIAEPLRSFNGGF